ncbi:MAG TPA: zinc-ribbon domain-containing protein [Pyrinomonadaceae bacterium]|nr:zinc-ribbon domain-containing protein [Pyrinomonadaceae bacterium]
MLITCPNCATRLQFDKEKIPARPFSVRCPKCQQIINAQPPAQSPQGALAAVEGDLPVSNRSQQAMSTTTAAPSLGGDATAAAETSSAPSSDGDVLRMLAALLKREAGEERILKGASQQRQAGWGRRAMVCISPSYGNAVARALADDGYEVFAAPDVGQAVDRLRGERVDVLVVDPEFDMAGQGASVVSRELSSMRMPERRRVVYVQLSPAARTGDAHAALLAGANLVVSMSDLSGLPRALDKSIRELNDLYRDFNKALGLAEL